MPTTRNAAISSAGSRPFMTSTIRISPNTISDRVSACMKNPSGLFCKNLVTKWSCRRDLDHIELVFGCPMAIVAGIGQQGECNLELGQVLLSNRFADTV